MAVQVEDALDGVLTEHLPIAAQLLVEEGKTKAAALLLDVKCVRFFAGEWSEENIVLEVDHYLLDRFTEDVMSDLQWAFEEAGRDDMTVGTVSVRRTLPRVEGWRERVERQLSGAASNHARLVQPVRPLSADRLLFRDPSEKAVYEAFKRVQETASPGEVPLVAPNNAVRVKGHTWEVDFLVAYKGRFGVLHVDGRTHRGKWADDRSRDRILEDSGVAYVDRIAAEDTSNEEQVEMVVRRFLKRLAAH